MQARWSPGMVMFQMPNFAAAIALGLTASLGKLRHLPGDSHERANLKLVIGQIGWEAGELDPQPGVGNWFVLPADPTIVFADHDRMWQRAMRRAGDYYLAMIANCRGVPPNPDYN